MHRRKNIASKQPTPEDTPASKSGNTWNSNSNDEDEIVQGVGKAGFDLPSPSGINTWSHPLQVIAVLSYFVVLATATRGVIRGLEAGLGSHGEHGAFLPLALGSAYALVGKSHFVVSRDFENIMPPRGTWGIWHLPGSEAFHVAWTGVAELVLGLGAAGGGLFEIALGLGLGAADPASARQLQSVCAFTMFWLTVGVTPANIFMLTHGARFPKDSDPLPVWFHGVRLAAQSVLLGLLYRVGEGTFLSAFF